MSSQKERLLIVLKKVPDLLNGVVHYRGMASLLTKGAKTLRKHGILTTFIGTLSKFHGLYTIRNQLRYRIFTESDLQAQRKHCFPRRILFSIIVPLYDMPVFLLQDMINSVLRQSYPYWELCITDGSGPDHKGAELVCRSFAERDSRIRYRRLDRNYSIAENANLCLDMAAGEYIGLLEPGDLLHPAALFEVMRTILEKKADFIYTDEILFHDKPDNSFIPLFKSDYGPDSLCGNNYIRHFTVFRQNLLQETGGFDEACEGALDYDLILRLTERAEQIVHIPEILYYCRSDADSDISTIKTVPSVAEAGTRAVQRRIERLGLKGEVSIIKKGFEYYRIRYDINTTPLISIIIPNYEHIDDLRKCLNSVFEKTTYSNFEVLIVENNSTSQEIFDYYEKIQQEKHNVRVVFWPYKFNYSAINNFGFKYCKGDYILLLNNDIEVITPDWIQEMLMYAQRKDVGATGVKLLYPDNTIQHAGVGMGINTLTGNYFRGFSRGDAGYMGRLLYAQNLYVVTAACMMVRRDVWEEMGGLDESFAVAFNDVDLCMHIRKAGYLVVWTPFAELYHYESKSRGMDDTPEKMRRSFSEILHLRTRWQRELEKGDPYYNPNLRMDKEDFSIALDVRDYLKSATEYKCQKGAPKEH